MVPPPGFDETVVTPEQPTHTNMAMQRHRWDLKLGMMHIHVVVVVMLDVSIVQGIEMIYPSSNL